MPQVDPFIYPLPNKIKNDPDLFPFFNYLVRWAQDMWVDRGADESSIDNLEAQQTMEDGGNRNSRYIQTEIMNIWSHIVEKDKSNVNIRDIIDSIQSQFMDLKTRNNRLQQRVVELEERLDSGT